MFLLTLTLPLKAFTTGVIRDSGSSLPRNALDKPVVQPNPLETLIRKKRLDRATYCFRTQVFEAIGAVVVKTQLVIVRRNINHKLKVC